MPTLNPYLNFNGNTEEAFNFYKSVFGGEFMGTIARFGDTPEASKLKPDEHGKIMHIALPIGKRNIIMGTDALESMGHKLSFGNNFHISVNADSQEQADKLFKGLSEGGNVTVPMQMQFWGDYFGMVTDKFGIQWMMAFNKDFVE